MLSAIDAVRQRTPLWRPEWAGTIIRMREHPDAPRWNTQVGDRLTAGDLDHVRGFARRLEAPRQPSGATPPAAMIEWLLERKGAVRHFARALAGLDPARHFARVPLMTRADLQQRIEDIVPEDQALERLVINPTSGTTGQPILAPSHPRAVGCYDPLIQYCLRRHGIEETYGHQRVAAIQLCWQRDTIVYSTVHSYLDGAGFAKLNLDGRQWRSPQGPARYIADMAPGFLSGDPLAFRELLRLGADYRPAAILSCALRLSAELRSQLETAYGCPVIDFYSLNETGPIACSVPGQPGLFQVLPHDIHVEVTGPDGAPLPDGQTGDICVTGGRNPFLPLLRYRTGDRGSLIRDHGRADPSPLLELADSRLPVLFQAAGGEAVNPIDIGRCLRAFPVLRHRCVQHADRSLTLWLDCLGPGSFEQRIRSLMAELLGDVPLHIEPWDGTTTARDVYVREDA